MTHVVVGDGVAANGRAARILWANAQKRAVVEGRLRCFLCVVKCSAHQANLVALCAIEGAAVAAGSLQVSGFAAALAQGSPHIAAAGAATRLRKHLMVDYYEEFAVSARDYVTRSLKIICEPHPPNDVDSRRLQEL